MDHIEKFFRKLDPKRYAQVRAAQLAIEHNDLIGLDIKPMKNKKGWYRCRVRDVRLVFVRTGTGENILVDADFRGRIYKKGK